MQDNDDTKNALLTMDQLIEALMRLAIQLYAYSGGKAKGSENPYVRADVWQAGMDETALFAKAKAQGVRRSK